MFRVMLSFVLTVFLFVGLISTASVIFASNSNSEIKVDAQVFEKKDAGLSIKEIEMETATSNYSFTVQNSLR